jgi:hypothetical protein
MEDIQRVNLSSFLEALRPFTSNTEEGKVLLDQLADRLAVKWQDPEHRLRFGMPDSVWDPKEAE